MFLFVDRRGEALKQRHLAQILHRLSTKAGLPHHRRLHPHALRHFAATSWLRGGAGLDEVRRLPGHESLSTTLRYSSLVGADLQRAHRQAGGIERRQVMSPVWGGGEMQLSKRDLGPNRKSRLRRRKYGATA